MGTANSNCAEHSGALLIRHGSQLDDESLCTFMTEAEAMVNCRPLTVHNLSSPEGVEPLTPNHLLTMKTSVVVPRSSRVLSGSRSLLKEEMAPCPILSE